MDPVLGPPLWRVQERVCVVVEAVQNSSWCVVDNDPVSVRSHESPISDGGDGGSRLVMVAFGGSDQGTHRDLK